MSARLHDILWDSEKIAAFWNGLGTSEEMADAYFSRQRGKAVLRQVHRHLPLDGLAVDLGCGPGYFLDHLMAAGIPCEGADLSADSVAKLNRRLQGEPLFRSGRVFPSPTDVPFSAEHADIIFTLETLEHFLDSDLEAYLAGVYRILKRGGHLVVTVPFRENLDAGKVTCPGCGCRFHRVQHVRSFSEDSLRELLERTGLRTVVSQAVPLWPEWRIYLRSLRAGKIGILSCPECGSSCSVTRSRLRSVAAKLCLRDLRHLLYIGRKD